MKGNERSEGVRQTGNLGKRRVKEAGELKPSECVREMGEERREKKRRRRTLRKGVREKRSARKTPEKRE